MWAMQHDSFYRSITLIQMRLLIPRNWERVVMRLISMILELKMFPRLPRSLMINRRLDF